MKNQTQANLVKRILREKGEITRNFCLRNYISRLGAIVCDLKKEGWNIEGEFVKANGGKDYVYKLVKAPYIPKLVYDPERNCMVYQQEQTKLL